MLKCSVFVKLKSVSFASRFERRGARVALLGFFFFSAFPNNFCVFCVCFFASSRPPFSGAAKTHAVIRYGGGDEKNKKNYHALYELIMHVNYVERVLFFFSSLEIEFCPVLSAQFAVRIAKRRDYHLRSRFCNARVKRTFSPKLRINTLKISILVLCI